MWIKYLKDSAQYFQIPARPLSLCWHFGGGRTDDSHWASLAIKAYYSFQTYLQIKIQVRVVISFTYFLIGIWFTFVVTCAECLAHLKKIRPQCLIKVDHIPGIRISDRPPDQHHFIVPFTYPPPVPPTSTPVYLIYAFPLAPHSSTLAWKIP